MNQQNSECYRRETDSDEIDLADLVLILLRRKWLIVAMTGLVTLIAAGISLVLPEVYAVTAILEPGKDADGHLIENPQSIRENILGGAFDREISDKLGLKLDQIPQFNVAVPKNTSLVTIKIESTNPGEAVDVMTELIAKLAGNIERQLEVKRELINSEMRSLETKRSLIPSQTAQLERLISETEKKVLSLESARKKTVPDGDSSAISILLYLNEIQNQQIFLNSLYDKLNELKVKEGEVEQKISQLKIKQANIKGVNITKQPDIPEKPIKPQKVLIIALSFVLSLMMSILLAFMAEFMSNFKRQRV